MSTINKRRAKKAMLLLLGVSSVAAMGLIVSHGNDNQIDNDNITTNDKDLSTNSLEDIDKDPVGEIYEDNIQQNKKQLVSKQSARPPNEEISIIEVENTLSELDQFEKIKVMATGYTAGVESTGKDPSHPEYGITYSGVYVQRDINSISTIAADLDIFPLGTILYIPNYGYGIVADKGSAIKGKKIDLFFETVEDVYSQWGKKEVEVYVIKRGNGKVTESVLESYTRVAMVNVAM